MLKELLFPEQIGSHFLFKNKVIGLEIQGNSILGCKITYHGSRQTLTEWFNELAPADSLNLEDELVDRLKTIKQKGVNANFVLSVPAHLIIFKELKLPFRSKDEIEQVLPFELESLLPFSLDQALYDCVIIDYDANTNKSTVLVAVAQKELLEAYTGLCSRAGIELSAAIIDVFAVYETISMNQSRNIEQQNGLLIMLYNTYTTLAYSNNGSLKSLRTIKSGLQTILKAYAQEEKISYAAAVQQVAADGMPGQNHASINSYLDELVSAAQSLQTMPTSGSSYDIYLCYNSPLYIPNLPDLLTEKFHATTSVVDSLELNGIKSLSQNFQSLDYKALVVASTTLYKIHTDACNLLRNQERERLSIMRAYQTVTAIILGLVFLLSMGGYFWYTQRALTNKIAAINDQTTKKIVDSFQLEKKKRPLKKVIEEARDKQLAQAKVWQALSGKKTLYSVLLAQLTNVANKAETNISIKKLLITDTSMQLNAAVPGYPELRLLEENIKNSTFFTLQTVPQEPTFQITLLIKGSQE